MTFVTATLASIRWSIPLTALACLGAAALFGAAVGLTGSPLPFALLMAILVMATVIVYPDTATIVFAFILYLNLSVIAVTFHGVPFPIAAAFILLPAVPVMAWWIRGNPAVVRTPALLLLLAYSAVMLASGALSTNLDGSLPGIGTFLSEGLLLYILVTSAIRSHLTLDRIIWVILLTGAIMGGLSLFQEVTASYSQDFGGLAQITSEGLVVGEDLTGEVRQPRLGGPMGEQNRYAQVLLVLFPLALYQFRRQRGALLRIAALGAGALILAGVALTYSRGAALALGLVVVAMIALGYVRGRSLAFVGVLLVGVTIAAGPALIQRVGTLSALTEAFSATGGASDGALQNRATVNVASWNVFLDHPLIGVGPGQFAREYSAEYSRDTGLRALPSGSQVLAHNLYLHVAAESGILGFGAMFGAVGMTAYVLWRQRRWWRTRDQYRADLAGALLLSMLAYLTTGIFLHLSYERYFWFLLALANVACWLLVRDRRALEAEGPTTQTGAPAT